MPGIESSGDQIAGDLLPGASLDQKMGYDLKANKKV